MSIYKKSEKWKLYLDEIKAQCLFLKSQMQCQQIEELHLEVFKNSKLEDQTRVEFGANIYAIDNYYNPKCEIDSVFKTILEI